MPRRARLDAPGTLHHVIVRGIEKRRIVGDVADRKNFVERLGQLAVDTETRIYAWALMSNHAHILLRSSEIGLSAFMRRLLTGYAIYYNRHYVEKGIDQGRRPELVGGGLIRSLGGWSAVKALRRTGDRELSDERILGSGEFVEQIIKEAEANIKYQLPVLEQAQRIDEFISKICKNEKVPIEELKGGSRRREASRARARIAIGLVKTHGVALAEVARRLGVTTSAISKIVKRASQ